VAVLTVKEVSRLLKLTTKTVYKLIAVGELVAVRVGGQWRVNEADLEQFLHSKKSI
jgi:excisionase family DNA binding protein